MQITAHETFRDPHVPGGETLTLVIRAKTLQELFDQAVRSIADQLSRADLILPRESRSLEVEAADPSRLLGRWLEEILRIHSTEGTLFVSAQAEIRDEGSCPLRLRGHLWGEPRNPDRHPLRYRIESSADPEVWFDGGLWRARMHLDLLPV